LLMTSFLLPGGQCPPEPLTIALSFFIPILLVGFLIYGANLRDERTVLISDKATRNGFLFVLYVVPLLVVVLSVTGSSAETLLTLVMVWIGAVAAACLSAFYYYHK
jgi:uncharacterized membrane protein